MSKGRFAVVVAAAALAWIAGCKGSDEGAKVDAPPPPPALPTDTAAAAPASTSEVATYPTEVAMGGTVATQQIVKVYQAADPASTLLTTLGPNTLVETKSRYGDWVKIAWPSGVGKLSPGWVQSTYLGAPKVIVDAGVVDSGPAPVDAGDKIPTPTPPDAAAPTPTDAGATRPAPDAGPRVRPHIILPKK